MATAEVTTSAVAALGAALAVLAWRPPRRPDPHHRLDRLTATPSPPPPPSAPDGRDPGPPPGAHTADRRQPPAWRLAGAGSVAIGGVLLLGVLPGTVVGLGLAAIVLLVGRPDPRPAVDEDLLPFVVDLMAGCLAAGSTPAAALDAASDIGDEGIRWWSVPVVAALRSGAGAEEAWSQWLTDDRLAPVARTLVRCAGSGAAAADELRRTARRLRSRRRSRLQQRVSRASVLVVLPLGLCFLPAFVLVAVVPVVVGLLPSLR